MTAELQHRRTRSRVCSVVGVIARVTSARRHTAPGTGERMGQ
jgi:hypothetical protein